MTVRMCEQTAMPGPKLCDLLATWGHKYCIRHDSMDELLCIVEGANPKLEPVHKLPPTLL